MDDIISKAKGCEYVSWLLCVCCVDMGCGVGDNGVTWLSRWMGGFDEMIMHG